MEQLLNFIIILVIQLELVNHLLILNFHPEWIFHREIKVTNLSSKIKILFVFRHLAATIMSEDTFDNTVLRKASLANILATPTVRQMAKELQVNRR